MSAPSDRTSTSTKAGLEFPVARIEHKLKSQVRSISRPAAVYISAAVENLIALFIGRAKMLAQADHPDQEVKTLSGRLLSRTYNECPMFQSAFPGLVFQAGDYDISVIQDSLLLPRETKAEHAAAVLKAERAAERAANPKPKKAKKAKVVEEAPAEESSSSEEEAPAPAPKKKLALKAKKASK